MPGVILYRQRDHAAVAYPSRRHPAATVATSGCGPTALSMVLANLLGLAVSPAETAAFALEHGARAEGGTNMRRLAAQAALRWPLKVTETCDTAELLAALQGGAMAICNTAGDRPGRKGVFSSGGHYVVAAGGDKQCLLVLDPGIYPGKYRAKHRAEAVTVFGDALLCSPKTLEQDCARRSPRYYIFRRG